MGISDSINYSVDGNGELKNIYTHKYTHIYVDTCIKSKCLYV